ncbi:MAG: N-6 DNA methylase [Candidatus Omnitrophica bacterium]|nr:N-6 DNA methylase [Candidatus Omnitrophota bacterium]
MKTEAKKNIEKLISKYEMLRDQDKIKSYNEAQTRNEFIEPLFEYLGWDMRNLNNENEVATEEKSTSKDRPDLAFRLHHIPIMFLEAKALKIDLDEWRWAEQAINYSWNKGVTWAVLTDFVSIKVFNAEIPPRGISDNLFFEISYRDYLNKFDQLWLLSKEGFEQGLLSKEAEKWGKLTKRKQVSEKLFEDLNIWRSILSKGFSKDNKLTQDELDEGVQRILDRLMFIRTAEDRDIEPKVLLPLLRSWQEKERKEKLYPSLVKIFRQFDDGYNSKIFAVHFSETWNLEDNILCEVIEGLYTTKDGYRYDFSAISADVLGGIYEQYLGNILKQAKKGTTILEGHKKRKSQGIYYTPRYIVDFIVKETLGEVLKNIESKDISKIKVLDPACGSGSFLTCAYDEILHYYEKDSSKLNLFTQLEILKDNIYGVDLDVQAVEIAQLNLLLKALSQKAKLPTLQHNIRAGNSLISGDEEILQPYFGNSWKDKKAFNWENEFKEVFAHGGFDVIIGNPPYLSIERGLLEDLQYFKEKYRTIEKIYDIFGLFIEKSLVLLKTGGYLGFIVPNTILQNDSFRLLRKKILESAEIISINNYKDGVFTEAIVPTAVLILKKQNKSSKNEIDISIYQKANLISKTMIMQSNFLDEPFYRFNLSINNSFLNLKDKLYKNSLLLKDILKVQEAIKTGDDKKFISDTTAKSKNQKILLKGGDIDRYLIKKERFIDYDVNLLRRPGKKEIFDLPKKLYIRRISNRLIAIIDTRQRYAVHTLYTGILIKENYYYEYILALLNSKLFTFLYRNLFPFKGNIFPEIRIGNLGELPVKDIEKNKQMIFVSLVDKILKLNVQLGSTNENSDKWNAIKSETSNLDLRIDEEIYKLYGITEEEKRIIEGNRS